MKLCKHWRRCKHCYYQNYIEFKDEKPLTFRCDRCGEETKTAKHLSTLKDGKSEAIRSNPDTLE